MTFCKKASFPGNRLMAILPVILYILLCPCHLAFSNIEESTPMPFSPGERLVFELRWSAIPAGQAVLEVLPMRTINGVRAYHFRMTAESNSFVDIFYKVRDRIDSYVSDDMRHSVHYRKKQREGSTKRDVRVDFDWKNAQAVRTIDNEKSKEPVKLAPRTFDPLSVFYFTRTQPLAEKGIIESAVTDGKKCIQGIGRVIKREKITVFNQTFDTFLIEPDLKHIGGVFEKKKDAKIKLWVTADERRIPVKISSKVAIGSFIGELVSIETGK